METVMTVLFFGVILIAILVMINSIFNIKIPYAHLLFDIGKYMLVFLTSSILFVYGSTLLGILFLTIGLGLSLFLQFKK